MLCDYGCGQEGLHQFKNGKWCCSSSKNSCPIQKMFGEKNPSKREDVRKKLGLKGDLNPAKRPEVREQISNSVKKLFKDPTYLQHHKEGQEKAKSSIEEIITTELCNFGCNQVAKFKFKNGQLCCREYILACPNIAANMKDKEQSIESNRKRSDSWTEEMRKTKSEELEERWMDPDYRLKMIEQATLSNNGNWRGGISYEPYPLTFTGSLRKEIKERDNHLCQNPTCYGTSETLSVHHIDYDKNNSSKLNLITVCDSCHGRTNGNRDYWKIFYKEIISSK